MSPFNLIILILIHSTLNFVNGQEDNEFTEDKELLYLRRRQQTLCNETSCIIKFFDASQTPFFFVSECKADKIKTISFENVVFVDEFPMDLFQSVRNIKFLTMNFTSLRDLKPETFKLATFLEEITLVNNSIVELKEFSFDGMKLKKINLAKNKIEKIDVRAFERAPSLRFLNLADNLIESLDSRIFVENTRLFSIDLSGNKLTSLDSKIFYSLIDLSWIYLQHNELNKLVLDFHFNSLYWLNADYNSLDELIINAKETRSADFCYVTANHNRLGKIKISPKFNVKNLYLESNNLIDLFDIKSMNNLADLRLGNCHLKHVTSIVFNEFKNLELLYLQNTNISALRSDLLVVQKKLKTLHVGYNKLGFIDLRFLKDLKALDSLYIDGNELVELNVADIKENLPNLKKIELRSNKWNCRNLKSILSYLKAYEIELISKEVQEGTDEENIDGIRCYESDGNSQELQCQLKDLEVRLKAVEQAYNENLKVMKENGCCNLSAAKEIQTSRGACSA